MANVPISNMTATWTDSGTTYNAIKMNVIDTASAAGSLLMDLQVGGVSKFKVPKNGNPVFVVPTSGFLEVNGNGDGLRAVNGSSVSAYSVYGVRMGASNTLSWGSSADGPATADTILVRDNAADTLALRRTTNAQTFRVYTSYTDASNNQFCQITGNGLTVQQAGLGAAADLYINNAITGRSIFLQTANTPRWQIGATGNFIAATDNAYDIGTSSNLRPRFLHLGGGSLTGTAADSSVTISPTWNTTGTPTAILLNVTDTASNANSLLMDLGTGGGTFASKFKVSKAGDVYAAAIGPISAVSMYFGDVAGTFGMWALSGGIGKRMTLASSVAMSWNGANNAYNGSEDVALYRDAAAVLAQRVGTNPQTFRVYNTFTDASNYERGKIAWSSNVLQIGTEKLGTGTARALELQTDGTTRLTIASGGGVTVQAGFALTCEYLYGPSTRLVLGNNANQLVTIGGFTSSFPALKRVGANLQTVAADDTATAGLIVGNQALATTATDGFLYVPTCAGTPTGVPTARTGTVPIVVDTTNNKLYFYSGAAWRDAGP